MRAAVVTELPSECLEIVDLPGPIVEADDDVVLRVEACGVCGTDLHILSGESYRPATPFVLGHEPVGTVVDAGPAARDWIGRRVTITLFTGEGNCAMCQAGDERLCPDLVSITGVLGAWGGYAEYLRVHERQLVAVPDALSPVEAATLVDSGATAANSVRVALARASRTVLVLGGGSIGHLCAELLRVQGISVQVVEPNVQRRAALARLGHDVSASIDDTSRPVDVIIDCVGVPSVVLPGLEALAPKGSYVLAGYTRVPDVDFAVVSRKEVKIRGIRSGRREDLQSIITLAAAGKVRLSEVAEWRLSEINSAIADLRDGRAAGKAVIVPDAVKTDRT